jgi:hypothetical protein
MPLDGNPAVIPTFLKSSDKLDNTDVREGIHPTGEREREKTTV